MPSYGGAQYGDAQYGHTVHLTDLTAPEWNPIQPFNTVRHNCGSTRQGYIAQCVPCGFSVLQASAHLAYTCLDGPGIHPLLSPPRLFPLTSLFTLLPSSLHAWHPAQTVLWGTFNGTVSSLQFQIRTEIFGNASYSATCMPVYVSCGQQLSQLALLEELTPGAWQ